MNRTVSHIISYLMHPGFMPGAFFAILLFMGKGYAPIQNEYKWLLLALVFNFTFLLPLLIVLLLYIRGYLDSLKVPAREERVIPFMLITVSYSLLAFLFHHKLDTLPLFGQIMSLMAITQAFSTMITTRFKISIHSIAITGVLGLLMALQMKASELEFGGFIVAGLLLSGLTMSARLSLDAHTPAQVYWGAVLGFGVNFFGTMLLI